jgi:hypothetical protein
VSYSEREVPQAGKEGAALGRGRRGLRYRRQALGDSKSGPSDVGQGARSLYPTAISDQALHLPHGRKVATQEVISLGADTESPHGGWRDMSPLLRTLSYTPATQISTTVPSSGLGASGGQSLLSLLLCIQDVA